MISTSQNGWLVCFYGKSIVICSLFTILLANAKVASAGGGPENVLLVVNSKSANSKAIANLYIQLRKIPPVNVISIPWEGSMEITKVEKFRKKILMPIINTMSKRKIAGQIDYIIYSSDFPYSVNLTADLRGQKVSKHLTPTVSINSATYFWQKVIRKDPRLLGLKTNQYMRADGKGIRDARSRGFRSWYGWAAGGARNERTGSRYMLSTMLAVTSGRGNTLAEVQDYLRSAAAADGRKPKGTIYYVKNNDVRSRARHNNYASAVAQLKLQGIDAAVLQGNVPQNRIRVIGTMMGVAKFNWLNSGSSIVPGAICEHFTSYGGVMRKKASQTPLSEFLRYGAAGASGTVVEPYALQDKFPFPSIQVHYTKGCSLAESYYQSVFGPFHLLIVGDPLCQPWANIPQIQISGIRDKQIIKGKISITPKSVFTPGVTVKSFELFIDGIRIDRCAVGKKFNLDTTRFPDGYHELRVVGIGNSLIEVQGRKIISMRVNNKNRKISLTARKITARLGEHVTLKVDCPGASRIFVIHNNLIVGQVALRKGTIHLDTNTIGQGFVDLYAIGFIKDDENKIERVMSKPLTLQISP